MNIKSDGIPDLLHDLQSVDDYDGFLSTMGSNSSFSDAHRSFYDLEEAKDQVFSPPLLMDASLLADSYEDLLGMFVPTFYLVDLFDNFLLVLNPFFYSSQCYSLMLKPSGYIPNPRVL